MEPERAAMPEAAVEFSAFAINQSTEAKEKRQNLPTALKGVLLDAIDCLTENPTGYPGRVRQISRTGNVFLYTHPKPPMEVTYEVDVANKIIYLTHFVIPVVVVSKPVFISYSHQDNEWLEELKKFLKPLEKQLEFWDDTMIKGGDVWRDEINKSLGTARAAILLVSQDFLTSGFISTIELPSLLDRAGTKGLKIFWIAVRASTYQGYPIEKYQALNDPKSPLESLSEAERNRTFVQIHDKIKEALSEA